MRTQLSIFLCMASLTFGETRSGWLVNSKCYDAEERNVNPTDTLTGVDRDKNFEIRYCAPTQKTKRFAVVEEDGSSLKLDPAGNAKAGDMVRGAGKKSRYLVNISGEISQDSIHVESLSFAK